MNNVELIITWVGFLIFPPLLITFGLIMWKKTPKQNRWLGYRTTETLSDYEAWMIANHLAGKLFFIIGLVDLAIFIPLLILTMPNKVAIGTVVWGIIVLLSLIIPIIVVELRLKRIE